MAWTDEMVEKLKEYWAQGVTTGEIGKRLGISKNSIVGKVHRLGLEGRPSPIKKSDNSDAAKSAKKSAPKREKKNAVDTKKSKPASDAKNKTSKSQSAIEAPKVVTPKSEPEKKAVVVENKPLNEPEVTRPVVAKVLPQVEEDDIKLIKSLEKKNDTNEQKENIALTELDNHTCRWPIGDPKDADFHFCGHKVKTGQTYCEEHAAIAYVKAIRR